MSKLGKKPIQIPDNTKIKVETGKLTLTGPMGSKELSINDKKKNETMHISVPRKRENDDNNIGMLAPSRNICFIGLFLLENNCFIKRKIL